MCYSWGGGGGRDSVLQQERTAGFVCRVWRRVEMSPSANVVSLPRLLPAPLDGCMCNDVNKKGGGLQMRRIALRKGEVNSCAMMVICGRIKPLLAPRVVI